MGASLGVDPVKEVLFLAATLVSNGLLATSVEPLDGRVGGDVVLLGSSLAIGSIGVNLGNQNILVVGKVMSNGLPNRGEVLAVCIVLSVNDSVACRLVDAYVRTREQ